MIIEMKEESEIDPDLRKRGKEDLNEADAENRFSLLADVGSPKKGLQLLEKLDSAFAQAD